MDKEKALENQGSKFREDIENKGGIKGIRTYMQRFKTTKQRYRCSDEKGFLPLGRMRG